MLKNLSYPVWPIYSVQIDLDICLFLSKATAENTNHGTCSCESNECHPFDWHTRVILLSFCLTVFPNTTLPLIFFMSLVELFGFTTSRPTSTSQGREGLKKLQHDMRRLSRLLTHGVVSLDSFFIYFLNNFLKLIFTILFSVQLKIKLKRCLRVDVPCKINARSFNMFV